LKEKKKDSVVYSNKKRLQTENMQQMFE